MTRPLSVPKIVQIEAMLNGRIEELFSHNGLGEEELVDVNLYLTVTRADLLEYFTNHPGAASAYFASIWKEPTHEAIMIQANECGYAVWISDHGIPRDVRSFATLEDA